MNIGKSVVIKGELSASEDLTIEGQVEGKVDLRQNTLTIGTNARITAQVSAKVVIVMGHVHGNIAATEKVDIRDNGSVDGDLSAPRVAIAEGAHFRGSIDMQQGKAAESKPASAAVPHPAPAPAPAAAVRAMFWNPRKSVGVAQPAPVSPRTDDALTRSKVFPKFLSAMSRQSNPVLLDLGPVVGQNIAFFGDRLACKIVIEDVYATIERAAVAGDRSTIQDALTKQFDREPASIDGILCWDVFDYLDRPAGRALAISLKPLLRSGGALYGLFGTTDLELRHYSRVTVESEDMLRVRPYPATPVRRTVHVNRDLNRMFEGLTVAESVLLKTSARECLFRKA